MRFFGRIAASFVIGWIVGVFAAVAVAFLLGDGTIGQIPAFTVPVSLVVTYLASFLVVRPRFW